MNYDHSREDNPKSSAKRVLKTLFLNTVPQSVIDVGCGTGSWLHAASELGATSLLGLDGSPQETPVEAGWKVEAVDLEGDWNLNRMFDLAICVEVAEHLSQEAGIRLIRNLCSHAELILFSAACPSQDGQGHISCFWPEYWQDHFNANGFACDDIIRRQLWNDPGILPWYRQNMFIARKSSVCGGEEPRLLPLLHPEMVQHLLAPLRNDRILHLRSIENGSLPASWYLKAPFKGLWSKIVRNFS